MKNLFRIALAVMIAAVIVPITTQAAPAAAYDMAQHPQCYVSDGAVVVRGAVAFVESQEPAPGMTVVLQYGDSRARATSGEDGTYTATFPREQPGAEVREVATYANVTGSLVPVSKVQSFASPCRPANVQMGALKQVQ